MRQLRDQQRRYLVLTHQAQSDGRLGDRAAVRDGVLGDPRCLLLFNDEVSAVTIHAARRSAGEWTSLVLCEALT